MIKILVLIDSSTKFSRRFLYGLIKYSKENGPWVFYRLPSYYKTLYGETGIIKRIEEWGINAVIAQWEYEEVDFLIKLDIPVFIQGYKEKKDNFSKISGNYTGAGEMAAKFFIKKRFKNFAFYGAKDLFWSSARAEGYRREIEKHGGIFFYFESELLNGVEWSKGHVELNDWLLSLPKPVALFACDDVFALQVSEICKLSNNSIPDELSLLGVDNDELICNLSYPAISSIVTDDENGGYNTGKMLNRIILNKKNVPFNIVIEPIRIELRRSTEKYNIMNDYILNVVKYIEDNYTSNISIEMLTKVVPLSRRTLEKRFKEEVGMSIYQFIIEKKVEQISNLLLTTEKSMFDIAMSAGYDDVRNVYRVFKQHTGITPTEFRKKFSRR